MSPKSHPQRAARFSARLWRYPGKGGWTFVTVPEEFAPPATAAWGRTPVVATVEGATWKTSVWYGGIAPEEAERRPVAPPSPPGHTVTGIADDFEAIALAERHLHGHALDD